MPKSLLAIATAERLLPEDRLAAAVEQAQRGGEPLAVVLVELEHVNESALAEALARHLGLPLVDLAGECETDALRLVSYDMARHRRLVPLALDTPASGPRILRVAMSDPTDAETLAELETTTGCKVEPVIASLAAIDDALRRVYHGLVTAIMNRQGVTPGGAVPAPAAPRRVPFGGNLSLATPAAPKPGAGGLPFKTEPYRNVEEEAPIELRFRALLSLLVDRGGVISQEDYWAELRKLLSHP